jgi:hypothetical protein
MLIVYFTSNEHHNSIVTLLFFTKHTTPLESIIITPCLWQAICDSAGINVEIINSIPLGECH